MQSVCLDEFGGEKSIHPSSQETTLIQHIFGGHLQSQVKLPTAPKTTSNMKIVPLAVMTIVFSFFVINIILLSSELGNGLHGQKKRGLGSEEPRRPQ